MKYTCYQAFISISDIIGRDASEPSLKLRHTQCGKNVTISIKVEIIQGVI